jgi:imidazolonepropionase
MPVLTAISTLYTCAAEGGQGAVHAIEDAALVWEGEHIRWVGPASAIPPGYRGWERVDAGGRMVIPGLVDCHTHLAFAGWRADEFEQRILGKSYLEIARAGGGIAATVRRTRAATDAELAARSDAVLHEMGQLGVTAVECKSGYGLDRDTELRLLRLYLRLAHRSPLRVYPTFLAHLVPQEYAGNRRAYLDQVVDDWIPEIARQGLAQYCDVFVEETAFTPEEGLRILEAGRGSGLLTKVHADQLNETGGASLAAQVGAVSADHLECVSDRGIADLAAAGVTAVSLPLASLYLGRPPLPARRLIEAGVPVAVATDFNPGSAPSCHLPLALTLACTLQRMTPVEALKGATLYGAKALGRTGELGSLEPGKAADFAVIEAEDVNHWLYHFQANACVMTVARGRVVWEV